MMTNALALIDLANTALIVASQAMQEKRDVTDEELRAFSDNLALQIAATQAKVDRM